MECAMKGIPARLLAAILVLLAVGLSACGYKPLYGKSGVIRQDMSQVRVGQIPNREGQILRNALLDRINPNGEPGAAPYTLNVSYSESLSQLAIRRDETATRANLRVSVTFTLREASSGVIAFKGRSRRTASYNIVQSDYANVVARRTAQRRAAHLVADDVSTRLALYFNRIRKVRKKK
jgi:LPS-assembly lipoprotein